MPFQSLKDLYIEQLRDLYDAEQQITQAMPRMIKASSSPDLRKTFQKHLEETRFQVERLDLIFKKLGQAPQGRHCRGIEGIIAEGEELMQEGAAPDVSDAALIASAQRVEHYEMAGYGCARTFADRLEDEYSADLLQQTLDEEQAADQLLTDLAESGINQSAGQGKEVHGSRLTYVNSTRLSGENKADFSEVRVFGAREEDLGRIDGFVVDRETARPYYVVVDSGGWFVGNRYLLPINTVRFDRAGRRMRVEIGKDTIKRYPKFDGDAFEFADERSREYETRLLEAYGREPVMGPAGGWDYERMEEFRQPEWWITEGVAVSRTRGDTRRSERSATRSAAESGRAAPAPPPLDPDRNRSGSEGRSTVDETPRDLRPPRERGPRDR